LRGRSTRCQRDLTSHRIIEQEYALDEAEGDDEGKKPKKAKKGKKAKKKKDDDGEKPTKKDERKGKK
jgi:hypothetical protein